MAVLVNERAKQLVSIQKEYELVCEQQRSSLLRNDALLRDILRLKLSTRTSVGNLESLKSRYLARVTPLYPQWLAQVRASRQEPSEDATTQPHLQRRKPDNNNILRSRETAANREAGNGTAPQRIAAEGTSSRVHQNNDTAQLDKAEGINANITLPLAKPKAATVVQGMPVPVKASVTMAAGSMASIVSKADVTNGVRSSLDASDTGIRSSLLRVHLPVFDPKMEADHSARLESAVTEEPCTPVTHSHEVDSSKQTTSVLNLQDITSLLNEGEKFLEDTNEGVNLLEDTNEGVNPLEGTNEGADLLEGTNEGVNLLEDTNEGANLLEGTNQSANLLEEANQSASANLQDSDSSIEFHMSAGKTTLLDQQNTDHYLSDKELPCETTQPPHSSDTQDNHRGAEEDPAPKSKPIPDQAQGLCKTDCHDNSPPPMDTLLNLLHSATHQLNQGLLLYTNKDTQAIGSGLLNQLKSFASKVGDILLPEHQQLISRKATPPIPAQWSPLWPSLVDHFQVLHDRGRTLEDVATLFAPVLAPRCPNQTGACKQLVSILQHEIEASSSSEYTSPLQERGVPKSTAALNESTVYKSLVMSMGTNDSNDDDSDGSSVDLMNTTEGLPITEINDSVGAIVTVADTSRDATKKIQDVPQDTPSTNQDTTVVIPSVQSFHDGPKLKTLQSTHTSSSDEDISTSPVSPVYIPTAIENRVAQQKPNVIKKKLGFWSDSDSEDLALPSLKKDDDSDF